MPNPSISMPDWMDEEAERRREKGTSKAEYVRKALMARFNAEDAGEWESPEIEKPKEVAEP